MVNRTMEVDDKQWVALHRNSEHKAVNIDMEKPDKPGKISKVSKGSERKLVFWRKGLPVINPYSKVYGWWCAFVLLTDATYTAFVVPIGVGFNTSSTQWDWVGFFDFYAGKLLLPSMRRFILCCWCKQNCLVMIQQNKIAFQAFCVLRVADCTASLFM